MSAPTLDAEAQARLKSLLQDLDALREGHDPSLPQPELDADLPARLVAEGSAYATLPLRFLERCGFAVAAPSELDDDGLGEALWRLIWVLGLLRLFLQHTDHLSDRELYTFLYEEGLQDPTAFMPGEDDPPFYFIDPLAGGEKEDAHLLLTYYADRLEAEEKEAAESWDFTPPVEPEPRPVDRDRFLP